MTIRQLEPDEYDRIKGHPAIGDRHLSPLDSLVVIAEEAGEIIGVWAALDFCHLEGFWIHPDHRKRTRLPLYLVKEMNILLDRYRIPQAFCWSADPIVSDYCSRLGMTKLPFDTFLHKVPSCP